MSEDRSREQIDRAAVAAQLLDNEVLQEAFSALEDSYLAAWKATPMRDVITREKLWLAVSIVTHVRNHLGKMIGDGRLAAADLNMKQRKNG